MKTLRDFTIIVIGAAILDRIYNGPWKRPRKERSD